MRPNLDQQMDEVVQYLGTYTDFLQNLTRRAIWRFPKVMERFGLLPFRQGSIDPLSGRTSPLSRALMDLLVEPEEKGAEPYLAFVGDYSIHQISCNLSQHFPQSDLVAIKELHDLRAKDRRLRENPLKEGLGLVLAISSLFLKSIPKTVIEKLTPLSFETFELGVFWVTAATLAYAALLIVPIWWSRYNARTRHDFVARVLEYSSLARPQTQPSESR